MILAAQQIAARSWMVQPFHKRQVAHGMTFGLGPAGYDVRIAETVELPRRSFLLASTMERFVLPDDLLMRVHDKSTWARRGLFVQNTVAEPGWRGYLTLELTNHGPLPVYIEAGMPIAQVVFEVLSEPTVQPYRGKYQDQVAGPQLARTDREPQPGDGPDYHHDHEAWERRQAKRGGGQ